MPPGTLPTNFSSLISVAAGPVVLVTATAILLSAYSAKYTAMAQQMRLLTDEFRQPQTAEPRRRNIKVQVRLFHRRITAMWASSVLLSLALLAFLLTVLAVVGVFVQRYPPLFAVVGVSWVLGLLFIGLAIGLELYEIHLARKTIYGELADVFSEAEV